MKNIVQLEERIASARAELALTQTNKQVLIGILQLTNATESVISNATVGFDNTIHKLNCEIGSLKNQLGYPTQKQEKLRKQRLKVAMDKLPQIVKDATWGTFGKDGNEPLKYVHLVDCDSVHLGLILIQMPRFHPYVSFIQQILEARKYL